MELTWIDATTIRNGAALAGFAVFLGWETIRPFFPFFKGDLGRRGVHIARNIGVGLLNAVLIWAAFLWLWRWAADGSAEAGFGLLHQVPMPVWLHALLAILLLDFWTYWWHRANHQIPFLWRFHRMHHSDPWMDVTSARRFHPGEIALSSLLRLPLIFILGIHLTELLLFSLLMGIMVDFHHANIALPERMDRLLRAIGVTPAMHKVHHSRIQAETDSNYTSLLSIWDRIFGSFRLRPDLASIRIGLDDWSDPQYQTLPGLLGTPLHRKPGHSD